MTFTQGSTYVLTFKLSAADGSPITGESAEKIEFCIGNSRKVYPSEDVYESDGAFCIRLSQEETFAMEDRVAIQARVKFPGSPTAAVAGSPITFHAVRKSISREVL